MSTPTRFKIGDWIATPELNRLESGERSLKLEPRTMDVLAYLARRAGDIVSIDELLRAVWQNVVVSDASVYHAIKQLRQALGGSDDAAAYIETIPKRGYRLTAPVATLAPAPASPAPPRESLADATAKRPRGRTLLMVAAGTAAVVIALLLIALGRWAAFPRKTTAAVATSFAIPANGRLGDFAVAVSPDGRYIAYAAGPSPEATMLYLRPRDALEARGLPGTQGASLPFWSPDSRQLGFRAGSKIERISLAGGPIQTIADAGSGPPGPATWNADGDVLFDGGAGIVRASAFAEKPTTVTKLKAAEGSHGLPWFFPDGRRFLYTSFKDPGGVFAQSLDSDSRALVVPVVAAAAYASGYLLLAYADGRLTAQPFDAATLTLHGEPKLLSDAASSFSVSSDGVLAHKIARGIAVSGRAARSRLTWYDRSGTKVGEVGEPGSYRGIALSRDGHHVAVHEHAGVDSGEIWVLDLASEGVPARRTFGSGDNLEPVWSPGGESLVYTGPRFDLYRTRASGAGTEDLVLDSVRFPVATDWSPDGRTLLITHLPETGNGVDVTAVTLGSAPKLTPLLSSPFNEAQAKFSPDGRWIAYLSDETGRNEIYVRPFPNATRQIRISAAGGMLPLWSADGTELFYLTADGVLMTVAVKIHDDELEHSAPQPLFKADFVIGDHASPVGELPHWPYAVAPDGQRFLVNERTHDRPPSAPQSGDTIAVIVDWPALLEQ